MQGVIIFSIMVKIGINKKSDYETYENFHNFSTGGVNFGSKILRDHPKINIVNYKKYIDEFYKKNKENLLRIEKESNAYIDKKQNGFWDAVKTVFGHDYKNMPFLGYLSIFDCNPRNVDTRTFQVYFGRNLRGIAGVAFHESIHFVFFDYINKNMPEEIRTMDKNSGPLWELSELFNVIILNMPEFQKTLKRKEKLFYPTLRKNFAKAKAAWREAGGDIDKFVFQYLKNFQKG